MLKYLIAATVVGIIAYGGWFLYQDEETVTPTPTPVTTQAE
jgi:hypothetical protein